ncbi:hypothetical protein CCB81_02560 [Armatimonadetes bacterium Uphvl-Ar2]|nr:hypothetical protein CCB81_02560 [Armatimonadetes bacterium Uphvl-Ar2]
MAYYAAGWRVRSGKAVVSGEAVRATGIIAVLENGGQREVAQRIAGHADSRTTKGYDRRATRLELSEIIQIRFRA